MSWTHPESTLRKERTSDALAIQLPSSSQFINKRIEGKKKEIAKLEKKLSRIRKVEAQNWEDPNPYFYSEYDLKWCLKELDEATNVLKKWEEELIKATEKANSRDVKIILEFLENWKKRNHDFYMSAVIEEKEMHKAIMNLREKAEEMYWGTDEHKAIEKEIEELSEIYSVNRHGVFEYVEKEYYNFKGQFVRKYKERVKVEEGCWEYAERYIRRTVEEGEAILNKDLEEEANRKYDFIIERTNEIVGQITDASNLKIGAKGDLNGYIIGTKGCAKVQTIGAGGYAVQCFHFRTLINKMK